MKTQLHIVYEGMEPSEFIDKRIRAEVDKLETFSPRIISCRVVIEAPHRRHSKGNLYTVRIGLTLPGGGEIVVDRNPGAKHAHEDPYVAIRDAFAAARRRLQDRVRKMRGQVKAHTVPPRDTG